MIKNWKNLINDGDILVENDILTKVVNQIKGDLVIDNSITVIGESVCARYTNLKEVIIPDGVTTIGQSAFKECTGLEEITLPTSITRINGDAWGGSGAFSNCMNLKKIVIQSSNFTLASKTFDGCSNVGEVIYVEGVTNIVGIGCKSAQKVTIPSSAISIGNSAFSGYTNLTEVTIPDGVTTIGQSAFKECTGLEEITLPKEFNKSDDFYGGAFTNCTTLKKVFIKSSQFTLLGGRTFDGCSNVEEVIYVEGVTNIVGIGCKSAQKVTIPSSAISIGNSAFSGYTNLTEVTIPDGVIKIGENAFKNVPHITYNGPATGSPWGALAIN